MWPNLDKFVLLCAVKTVFCESFSKTFETFVVPFVLPTILVMYRELSSRQNCGFDKCASVNDLQTTDVGRFAVVPYPSKKRRIPFSLRMVHGVCNTFTYIVTYTSCTMV